MKKSTIKRVLALLLTVCLMGGLAPSVAAYSSESDKSQSPPPANDGSADATLEGFAPIIGKQYIDGDSEEPVRISIVLKDKSTMDAGFDAKTIATNPRAVTYREKLESEQETMEAAIEEEVLENDEELDVVWNLTLAANIISANVPKDAIDKIASLPGVKEIVVEVPCDPQVISIGGEMEPNMAISGEMNGTPTVWSSGFTGAGMKVAVIDTGLDLDHISFDPDAFDYAIDEIRKTGKDVELMTESFLADKLSSLNIFKRDGTLTAQNLYKNTKVPFAYNYNDRSCEAVGHMNDQQGEHGSHVAGIATANRYVDSDDDGTYEEALSSVLTAGNAPDAQLLVMKVFGERSGATASDYMAAIEDAILLGADVINLSLGSRFAGFVKDSVYEEIMGSLENSGAVVAISSGNNSYWAENTKPGNLYVDGVNFATDGSPGTYKNAFTVASVDNKGIISPTVEIGGRKYTFSETAGHNSPISTVAGTAYDYIYIDNEGILTQDGQDTNLIEEFQEELSGKVVFIKRGSSSFIKKHELVAQNGGAVCVIVNNQDGTVNMSLADSTATIPCIAILQKDGEEIKEHSTPVYGDSGEILYYTGSGFSANAEASVNPSDSAVAVSDFSSWGVPGDLTLKPEISAPGGNIYSVYGANIAKGYENSEHNKYELMSGTSMASPQIAGLAALVMQYLEENDLSVSGLNIRGLTQSLLMSTASPLQDASSGSFYPVFQQGAGLASVANAVSTPVTITVEGQSDGKVKAELGDDLQKNGVYSVTFTFHNLTGAEQGYYLTADVFSQNIFEDAGVQYLDTATRAMGATVVFTDENGNELSSVDLSKYDFNEDGVTDRKDAQVLLDSIVAGTPREEGDVSGDGEITTYDVHLLLKDCAGRVTVPAHGNITITAKITLTGDEWDEYPKGAYVEAFLNADAVATGEGAVAPSLHVPVLGFYGNWSDSSMYDLGTYGEIAENAYLNVEDASQNTSKTKGQENYLLLGRAREPITDGYEVDANSMLTGYAFSLIRNAGGGIVQIRNADTGELYYQSKNLGSFSAAYWYTGSKGGAWYNQANNARFSWRVQDGDGNPIDPEEELTVSLIMAPEYYEGEDGQYDWSALTDGDIDNGELGAGAYLTTTLTTKELVEDLEPPEIVSTEIVEVTDEGLFGTTFDHYEIKVKVRDDVSVMSVKLYCEGYSYLGSSSEQIVYWYGPDCYDKGADYPDTPNFTPTKPGEECELIFSRKSSRNEVDSVYGQVLYEGASFVGSSYMPQLGLADKGVYFLEVTDAAGNVTKNTVYLGTVPETEADSVTILDADGNEMDRYLSDPIRVLAGRTYQLSAKVSPAGLQDPGVTWSSDNEDVAAVDETTGLVTAKSPGTANITATANAKNSWGGDVTAACEIEVYSVFAAADGVAVSSWDEGAHQFSWNFETGTYIEGSPIKDGEEDVTPVAVADIDGSSYYLVDANNTVYQMNSDGTVAEQGDRLSSLTLPWDMAYEKDVGLLWLYTSFLAVEEDPLHPNPDATMGFELTKSLNTKLSKIQYFALAVDGTDSDEYVSGKGYVDVIATVYLLGMDDSVTTPSQYNSKIKLVQIKLYLDENGELDYIGSPASRSRSGVEVLNTDLAASPLQGNEFFLWTEKPDCNMVLGEDGSLYLSVKNGKTGTVSEVYRLTSSGSSYSPTWTADKLGSFDEDTLPGLFLRVKNTSDAANAALPRETEPEPLTDMEPSEGVYAGTHGGVDVSAGDEGGSAGRRQSSRGALEINRILVSDTPDEDGAGIKADSSARTLTVPVSAASTNGKFTLSYDPAVLTLESVRESDAVTKYIDDGNGTITAGFADAEEFNGTVMVFTFRYGSDGDTKLVLKTDEDGTEKPGEEREYAVTLPEDSPNDDDDNNGGTENDVTTGDKVANGHVETETTATPQAAVSGSSANSDVSKSMGDEIVRQAEEYGSGKVVVAPKMPDTVQKAEVTIPGSTVQALGGKTDADLTVKTPVTDVTIPNEALGELGKGGFLTVRAEKSDDTVNIEIVLDGQSLASVPGGIKVRFSTKDGNVALLVSDDGSETVIPKSIVENGEAYVILDGSGTVKTVNNSKEFDDVADDAWYSASVDFVGSHALFNGMEKAMFSPDTYMTRSMLTTVLWRLDSEEPGHIPNPFTDVATGSWYENGVAWANEHGIVDGYGNGLFGPEDSIEREQLAVMIYRYVSYKHMDVSGRADLGGYRDSVAVSPWAEDAVAWAVANGILYGRDTDCLEPAGLATRAEVATILVRLVRLMVE